MRWSAWVLFGACTTGSTSLPGDDTKAGAPSIAVAQTALDFGTVSALSGETASLTLTILNEGDAELIIEDAWTDDAHIQIGQLYPSVVPPQETASLVVTYAPSQDVSTRSTLTLESNDTYLSVEVIGEGTAPQLARSVEAVDFGTVSIGCAAEEVVTLTNTGREDLVIDDAYLSTSSDVTIGLADAPPWTLAPDASLQLPLGYAPLDDFADSLSLIVSSNDPTEPLASVQLEGLGEDNRAEDTFTIDTTPDADIVFAIDKSCSMADDIAKLVFDFPDFLDDLDAGQIDYRIAAVVQDSGSVSSIAAYIEPGDPEASIETLEEMLAGSYGGYTEQAFTLLYNAMGTGANRPGGWLRDDAALHLIGMSDESEQSTLLTWDGYVSHFQSLKDNPDHVVMHAIGGDYPSGCSTASPYAGFYEATVATGGGFWSICATEYAQTLEDLAEEIVFAGANLQLSVEPAEETVIVTVDGAETAAWSLVDRRLVFDTPPPHGATVTVRYTPADACP